METRFTARARRQKQLSKRPLKEMSDESNVIKIYRPAFCPTCGAPVETVRHVIRNIFEMMCDRCQLMNVVATNDHVKIT